MHYLLAGVTFIELEKFSSIKVIDEFLISKACKNSCKDYNITQKISYLGAAADKPFYIGGPIKLCHEVSIIN